MFSIDYKITNNYSFETGAISDEEIRYDLLLGNVSFVDDANVIEMEWEWIPLLDFAYCLHEIVNNLKDNDTEYFEFTENVDVLKFLKKDEYLEISSSFSTIIIDITFKDFENAVNIFHFNISDYIRKNISNDIPHVLQKYLKM